MKADLRVIQKMVDMMVDVEKFTYQMNRNAPRPAGEYAAIKLRKTINPGYDKIEYIEGPFGLTMRSKGIRILEIDILFSRDDEEIDTFNNSFHNPNMRSYLEQEGYALMSRQDLNIKDRKFETDWEVRTGVTITLSTIRTQDVLIEEIKAVEINGELNEGLQSTGVGPIKVGDIKE